MLEFTGWLGHEQGETGRIFLEAEGTLSKLLARTSYRPIVDADSGSDGGRLSSRLRTGGAGVVEGVTFWSFHVSMDIDE